MRSGPVPPWATGDRRTRVRDVRAGRERGPEGVVFVTVPEVGRGAQEAPFEEIDVGVEADLYWLGLRRHQGTSTP